MDVYNNACFMQLLVSPRGDAGTATWGQELFLAPGHRTLIRKWIFGIRFRSAVAGEPARVTVELIAEDETWLGYLLTGGRAP